MAHDIDFDDVEVLKKHGYEGDDEEVISAYRDNFFECNGCGTYVYYQDDCPRCALWDEETGTYGEA